MLATLTEAKDTVNFTTHTAMLSDNQQLAVGQVPISSTESTKLLTSEQRFARICALDDLMKSGDVHLQLKRELLHISTLLPQEIHHMDSILRSVRPDVSLENFCGLLIDTALLRADAHSLTRYVRHTACLEVHLVKTMEWVATRLKTFKAMERWSVELCLCPL